MKKKEGGALAKGQLIGNYIVAFFLKKGKWAETYRVSTLDGRAKILKLFFYSKLDRTQFNLSGNIVEIEILKNIKHPNIARYYDKGEVILNNQKFPYLIFDFISGETLADKMKREQIFNPYEAKDIVLGVLNGLNYLHNREVYLLYIIILPI